MRENSELLLPLRTFSKQNKRVTIDMLSGYSELMAKVMAMHSNACLITISAQKKITKSFIQFRSNQKARCNLWKLIHSEVCFALTGTIKSNLFILWAMRVKIIICVWRPFFCPVIISTQSLVKLKILFTQNVFLTLRSRLSTWGLLTGLFL